MKITIILIVLSVLQVSATGYGQEISINQKKASLEKVLRELRRQSGYDFFYNAEVLKKANAVSINAVKQSFKAVLDKCMEDQPLTYSIEDKTVIIREKNLLEKATDLFQELGDLKSDVRVTGTVKDDKGETLPGVSVKVKGASTATSTDVNGKYTIQVSDDAVLVFSYMGFEVQEIPVSGKQTIDVVLKQKSAALEEVVVVGFGSQKKASLTGAISQVKGEDVFKNKGVNNVGLALQGEVPGLVVTRSSSRPGNEGLNLKIRGDISADGKNSDPLIILDGVVSEGWEISQLNPNDVESISVLKDASAAIYGARSAGGVILVTTKRGKAGKPKINYNGMFSQSKDGIKMPNANMQQWAQMFIQASENDGRNYWWIFDKERFTRWAAGEQSFSYVDVNGVTNYYEYANIQDRLYGQSTSNNHNLSLSGASDKVAYRASVGFADNQAPLKTAYDGEKKWTSRFNLDYKASEALKINLNTSYDKRTVQNPTNGVGAGWADFDIFPVYNANGQYYDTFGGRNPIAETSEGGNTVNTEEIFRFNPTITIGASKLVKGLSFSGTAAIRSRKGWKTAVSRPYNLYDWTGSRVTFAKYSGNSSKVEETMGQTLYQNYYTSANYDRIFASKHHISGMIGISGELSETKKVIAGRKNITLTDLEALNTVGNIDPWNNGEAGHNGLFSYISRLNYDFKGRYLFEAIGRRDGSSRFHPDYRYNNFYSLQAGWRLSEEKFIKDLKVFNNLKLRGSFGQTGGISGIGENDYVSTVSLGSTLMGVTSANQQSLWVSGITSKERGWELIQKQNYGIDFSVLKSRLSGSFDYYINDNKDMLMNITYPSVLGDIAPTTNSGHFQTKGWELALDWNDAAGDVRYSVGFNLGDNKSDVKLMAGKTLINPGKNDVVQGYPLGSIFVFKTNGYFPDAATANVYNTKYTGTGILPTGNAKVKEGSTERVDLNGDGKITNDDTYYYGDSQPHLYFGFKTRVSWKAFDFSALFQGVGKKNILRTGNLRAPFVAVSANQNASFLGNTWTPQNPNAEFPILSWEANLNKWNYDNNDFSVQNLRYIRLKNIVLGYSIPKKLISKAKIEGLRLYISADDIFEFTSVKDGYDPEYGEGSNNTYPFNRLVNFGVDITL